MLFLLRRLAPVNLADHVPYRFALEPRRVVPFRKIDRIHRRLRNATDGHRHDQQYFIEAGGLAVGKANVIEGLLQPIRIRSRYQGSTDRFIDRDVQKGLPIAERHIARYRVEGVRDDLMGEQAVVRAEGGSTKSCMRLSSSI